MSELGKGEEASLIILSFSRAHALRGSEDLRRGVFGLNPEKELFGYGVIAVEHRAILVYLMSVKTKTKKCKSRIFDTR